jgi:hypothetical protein
LSVFIVGDIRLGSIVVDSVVPRYSVAGVGITGFKARIEVMICLRLVRLTLKMRSVSIR